MCVNCRTPMSLKRTCRRETGDMETLTDAADTDRRHGETLTNAERPVPKVEGGDETHAGHLLPQLWVVGVVGGQRDGVVAAQ